MLVEVLSVSFRESLVCSIDLTSFRGMESTMVVESSPLVKNIISLLKIILRFCQCLCEYSYQKQALATTFRFHSIKNMKPMGSKQKHSPIQPQQTELNFEYYVLWFRESRMFIFQRILITRVTASGPFSGRYSRKRCCHLAMVFVLLPLSIFRCSA